MDSLKVAWDQRYWRRDLEMILKLEQKGLSVHKLDLDNFKVVNDILGHDEGDEAIRQNYASRIRGVAEIYRRGGTSSWHLRLEFVKRMVQK